MINFDVVSRIYLQPAVPLFYFALIGGVFASVHGVWMSKTSKVDFSRVDVLEVTSSKTDSTRAAPHLLSVQILQPKLLQRFDLRQHRA